MPGQNGQNENCRLFSAPSSVVGKYDLDMYQCPLLAQSGHSATDNFGGALDHLCDRDGNIVREGLRLMARPVEIQRVAEAHDKRAAKAAVDQMKASHQVEGVTVSMPGGGSHPSALRQNRHKQTFEPGPKIPS
jgi:hypothetical protein